MLLQLEAGKLFGPDEMKADERHQPVIESRQPVAETQQGVDENVDHEGKQQVDVHQREKRRQHDGHGQQDDCLDRADARKLAVRLDFTIAFFGHGSVGVVSGCDDCRRWLAAEITFRFVITLSSRTDLVKLQTSCRVLHKIPPWQDDILRHVLKRHIRAGHERHQRGDDGFGAEHHDGRQGHTDELLFGFLMPAAVRAGHVEAGDDQRDDHNRRGQDQQRIGQLIEGLNDGLHSFLLERCRGEIDLEIICLIQRASF